MGLFKDACAESLEPQHASMQSCLMMMMMMLLLQLHLIALAPPHYPTAGIGDAA